MIIKYIDDFDDFSHTYERKKNIYYYSSSSSIGDIENRHLVKQIKGDLN